MNNRVLEDACKNDTELRAVLGDSIGNPQLMKERVCYLIFFYFQLFFLLFNLMCSFLSFQVEDRIRKKGKDFRRSKTGSVVAPKVTFREYV